ncbi:hypothetical protein D3C81_1391900 [compost metagenome]
MTRRTANRLESYHKVCAKRRHRLVDQKTAAQKGQKDAVAEQLFDALRERLAHHMILLRLLRQCQGNNHRNRIQDQKRQPDCGYREILNIQPARIGPYSRSYAHHQPDAAVRGPGFVRGRNGVRIGDRGLCRREDGGHRVNQQQYHEIFEAVKDSQHRRHSHTKNQHKTCLIISVSNETPHRLNTDGDQCAGGHHHADLADIHTVILQEQCQIGAERASGQPQKEIEAAQLQ